MDFVEDGHMLAFQARGIHWGTLPSKVSTWLFQPLMKPVFSWFLTELEWDCKTNQALLIPTETWPAGDSLKIQDFSEMNPNIFIFSKPYTQNAAEFQG
jgi:hypothetical protein